MALFYFSVSMSPLLPPSQSLLSLLPPLTFSFPSSPFCQQALNNVLTMLPDMHTTPTYFTEAKNTYSKALLPAEWVLHTIWPVNWGGSVSASHVHIWTWINLCEKNGSTLVNHNAKHYWECNCSHGVTEMCTLECCRPCLNLFKPDEQEWQVWTQQVSAVVLVESTASHGRMSKNPLWQTVCKIFFLQSKILHLNVRRSRRKEWRVKLWYRDGDGGRGRFKVGI